MYLNYYAAEINDEQDNAPIGIILCTEKDSIAAEYALGGLSNNIYLVRDQLVIAVSHTHKHQQTVTNLTDHLTIHSDTRLAYTLLISLIKSN